MVFMRSSMELAKIGLYYNSEYSWFANYIVLVSGILYCAELMYSIHGRQSVVLMPPMATSSKFLWKEDSQTMLQRWCLFLVRTGVVPPEVHTLAYLLISSFVKYNKLYSAQAVYLTIIKKTYRSMLML